MDWTLLLLPGLLVASLILLSIVKSKIDEGTGTRDHSSIDEAEAVIRARGGPGPG